MDGVRPVSQPIVLTVPDELAERARAVAAVRARSVEALLLDYLNTLALPALPADQQAELDALGALSDDALFTIAREQVPADVQRVHTTS
jgi:hypothetical protein